MSSPTIAPFRHPDRFYIGGEWVLSVISARDEADAVRVANDTIYGLNASILTTDVDRAHRVSREIRLGTVGQNVWRADTEKAFGEFKQSSVGRDCGRDGLMPFLETKVVPLEQHRRFTRPDTWTHSIEFVEAVERTPMIGGTL